MLDKRLKQQFALELGDRWLTEEMEAKPEKTVRSIGVTSVTGQKLKMQETHNGLAVPCPGAVGAVFRHTLMSNH